MLYSRAGTYPPGQPLLYAESFSPNTPEGACPECHGLGRVYEVTEETMVPNPDLSIRERAIASWPSAWQGQNLRDILVTLGYDVDVPWKELPRKDRDWILYTDEQPQVPVYAGFTPHQTAKALKEKREPSYMGTYMGARKYVLHTFANSQSAMMKKRVSRYMRGADCPLCHGKKLKPESLSVHFAGLDIAEMSAQPLKNMYKIFQPYADGSAPELQQLKDKHEEKIVVIQRIAADLLARLDILLDLGLGYLSLDRTTPTLSPGEHQRLRLATQVRSNLFGVVYVLDEPSAGLHPADTLSLLKALDGLKAAGNSLFVVEHDLEVIRNADWIVDVGPDAGEGGGEILYSGPPRRLQQVERSSTRKYLYDRTLPNQHALRKPTAWLELSNVSVHNLKNLDAQIPLGVLTSVTGISGSGKSSLISKALVELMRNYLQPDTTASAQELASDLENEETAVVSGTLSGGQQHIKKMVLVDQKPIGRTPRSNLATYTGLFDNVRKLFASTPVAKKRKYDAGRFSFNVGKGRCPNCEGEGFVMVELLFLPNVYAPCPVCKGTRYKESTLEVTYHDRNIAEVLAMTVDQAADFFSEEQSVYRALKVLQEVGLGYLRLGQPATELSGGEAQRIKLATELQRQSRGQTLFILDEPTTGLHPADVEKLMAQLQALVDLGNTVVLVEHDMRVVAASDYVIDMGPGAGDEGGNIVVQGTPVTVAASKKSRTAPFLKNVLDV